MSAERFEIDIDASLGFQTILINTTPTDGRVVSFGCSASGLDGTGCDLDFFQANSATYGATAPRISVGTTLNPTPASGEKTSAGGDMNCDHLYVDFEPNDATTGTVTVNVTFKS